MQTKDLTIPDPVEHFEHTIVRDRDQWTLLDGADRSTDLVNHVLRVVHQIGRVPEYEDEFHAFVACQSSEGGFGNSTRTRPLSMRNTGFAGSNLIWAYRASPSDELGSAIERLVSFLLAQQEPGGFWSDPAWGARDATAASMGVLTRSLGEDFLVDLHDYTREALAGAVEYLERTQADDGSWEDPRAYEAPIGPTGHLLPKLAAASEARTPAVAAGISYLVEQQDEDGSWDNRHTDHTCDATRALILTGSVVEDERIPPAVEVGVEWLLGTMNDDWTWSEHPGEAPSLLMTCDVLDCFAQFESRRQAADLASFYR